MVGHGRIDVAGHAHVQDEQVWSASTMSGVTVCPWPGGDNQHPCLADGRGQPVEGRWREPVHVRRVSGLGFVAVDHSDGRLAGVLRKVLACVSPSLPSPNSTTSTPSRLDKWWRRHCTALNATDVAPELNPVSDFTRLLALSTNDTTRSNHATSPPRSGLTQRQLQLTGDFCVAWDLGFEAQPTRNKCATASIP